MYRFSLVFFATFTVAVGISAGKLVGRIMGGQPAEIQNHPYQVLVLTSANIFCGGVILKPKLVLTAAHCTEVHFTAADVMVQYGLTHPGGTNNWALTKELIVHPKFNCVTYDYDIAVISLQSEIPLGVAAATIKLAKVVPAPGTHAVVTGWGKPDPNTTRSRTLQSLNMQIISREACQEQYSDSGTTITDRMLCARAMANGQATMIGDSGGPLVANGILVGILSLGQNRADRFPDIYVSIPRLRKWIKSKISLF